MRSGTKKIYEEGRDAFRSSVPYLRNDSVDAPSLWELEEMERERLLGNGIDSGNAGGIREEDGGDGVGNAPLHPPVTSRRKRASSYRGRT